MNKNEMMLLYEKETGKPSTRFVTDGIHAVTIEALHFEYVNWLVAQVAELRILKNASSLSFEGVNGAEALSAIQETSAVLSSFYTQSDESRSAASGFQNGGIIADPPGVILA